MPHDAGASARSGAPRLLPRAWQASRCAAHRRARPQAALTRRARRTAGTVWQALQRGLFHEPASRRPRARPLLEAALDVAQALQYLHGRRLVRDALGLGLC